MDMDTCFFVRTIWEGQSLYIQHHDYEDEARADYDAKIKEYLNVGGMSGTSVQLINHETDDVIAEQYID